MNFDMSFNLGREDTSRDRHTLAASTATLTDENPLVSTSGVGDTGHHQSDTVQAEPDAASASLPQPDTRHFPPTPDMVQVGIALMKEDGSYESILQSAQEKARAAWVSNQLSGAGDYTKSPLYLASLADGLAADEEAGYVDGYVDGYIKGYAVGLAEKVASGQKSMADAGVDVENSGATGGAAPLARTGHSIGSPTGSAKGAQQ
ncbi:uncharacterized protein LOC62_01G000767 [Vanrija pseudolonga]|uniref:Uncharacterized protein n=1 Tax=Vanrija pseudolonga TaxID=143232 RepID=A0AAF0XZP3_9TREE|nr:hypothetical protein LOC62_01G000767 [Vanrija pseudolonga]